MSLVLDASSVLAWLHEDEIATGIDDVFRYVAARGAVVPALWHLEVANALTMSVRRGRLSLSARQTFLDNLRRFDIRVDEETVSNAWTTSVTLADRFRLTIYDAAYLELAQRRRLPLATLDKVLVQAAEGIGVKTLP